MISKSRRSVTLLVLFIFFSFPSPLISQKPYFLGSAAGLNSNSFGISFNYKQHLNTKFFVEGAFSLPMLTGYETINYIDPAVPFYPSTKIHYLWSYSALGFNIGYNFFDYKIQKSNLGIALGGARVFSDKLNSFNLIGASVNYSYLLSNLWNFEVNAGLNFLYDFEGTYPVPLLSIKYSKLFGLPDLAQSSNPGNPFITYELPDFRTVTYISAGLSGSLLEIGLQQYLNRYSSLELGIGFFAAGANTKFYPLNGYDGILDPFVGFTAGINWLDGGIPYYYIPFGLEFKPFFNGYETGLRISIDSGPLYFDDWTPGINLRLGYAFNDKYN
jgi:hypothetical protein